MLFILFFHPSESKKKCLFGSAIIRVWLSKFLEAVCMRKGQINKKENAHSTSVATGADTHWAKPLWMFKVKEQHGSDGYGRVWWYKEILASWKTFIMFLICRGILCRLKSFIIQILECQSQMSAHSMFSSVAIWPLISMTSLFSNLNLCYYKVLDLLRLQ